MLMEQDTKSSDPKYFNIQMAAELSGLSAHTIRAWEKRYQALTPERAENGRRLYSNREVERLTVLSQLTRLGSSIGQIARLPDEELNEIYLKLSQSKDRQQKNSLVQAPIDLEQSLFRLLDALKSYRMDLISAELEQLKQTVSPREIVFNIYIPMFTEVEKLKKQNILGQAQLQALEAVMKFHAGNIIYSYYEKKVKSRSKVALTSLEGDHQSSALLLSTLLCCHHHMNFFYLNNSLPTHSIIEAAKAIETTILILSVEESHISRPDFTQTINHLSTQLGEKIKIWLVSKNSGENIFTGQWKNVEYLKDLETLDQHLGKLV